MSNDGSKIQRFEGVPQKTGRRKERMRWKRFLAFFSSRFAQSDELAMEYANAYVDEKKAEAEIKANEAAKIAEETAAKRNKNTKESFSLIDDAFGANSDIAQELKIRQLLEHNPHLAEQLRLIAQRGNELASRYGTRIDVRSASEDAANEEQLRLPPPQDEVT